MVFELGAPLLQRAYLYFSISVKIISSSHFQCSGTSLVFFLVPLRITLLAHAAAGFQMLASTLITDLLLLLLRCVRTIS
jgi:hypothetical protein